MNMLGNLNHVFFSIGENKYPRMFIVDVWNIFSGFFFFIKFVKLVSHNTSPMNILGFFPIPKLGLKALPYTSFSGCMRNTILTTRTKRYTVRTLTRSRPLRVDSTLSAGPFICWHMTVKQSKQELLCL